MEPNISTKAFYSNEENMQKSLGLFDEGDLEIFETHINFKSPKSGINIEKEKIKNIEIVNKTPGIFEFAIVIVANLIIIAGYFSFEQKSVPLFFLLHGIPVILIHILAQLVRIKIEGDLEEKPDGCLRNFFEYRSASDKQNRNQYKNENFTVYERYLAGEGTPELFPDPITPFLTKNHKHNIKEAQCGRDYGF